jgi:ferrous iron transport protein B
MATANLTVALAGNPNSGKTTIFNSITGARQHVGNYPGVTVERREGFRRFDGKNMLVVDLPGTYSLTAHALDEVVARNFIIDEKPDIIVNILDTSNLERNLYLALQLLELERPMVLALNMADVAEKLGMSINDQMLSDQLGMPVVRTVGNRSQGIDELLRTVVTAAEQSKQRPFHIDYGPEIEAKIALLQAKLNMLADNRYPTRWLATKLLEADQIVMDAVKRLTGGAEIAALADTYRNELKQALSEEVELVIAERRYQRVSEIYRHITASQKDRMQTMTDKIDSVLTHRVLGLPIFFGIMWLMFNLVFTLGAYPQEWIENGFSWLGEFAGAHLAEGDLKSLIVDGIIGGVGGVLVFIPNILILFFGIALLEDTGYMARAAFVMDRVMRAVGLHGKSFIPLLMGFGCGVPAIMGTRTLENPRDRMVTILVSPLMSCSARLPVYTVLIGAFFTEAMAGTVLFSIYALGIVLAVLMAMIFRKFLFPGDTEPFVMEMPLYHVPTLRSILTHMWERSVLYLKKAGTLILAASIIVWFLTSYPSDVEYSKDYDQAKAQAEETVSAQIAADVLQPLNIAKLEDHALLPGLIDQVKEIEAQFEADSSELMPDTPAMAALKTAKEGKLAELQAAQPALFPLAERYLEIQGQGEEDVAKLETEQASEKLAHSYAGRFGHFIEPVLKPLGFDWKIGIGLFAGFAAKEVVVSTLGTIYSIGDAEEDAVGLQDALTADPVFSPLVALSLMAFVLIYVPCMAALSVIKRETNSWKWLAFTVVYTTGLAWVVSFIIYQGGSALGY